MNKKCINCGILLTEENFYSCCQKQKHYRCKKCYNQVVLKHRQKNKEHYRKYNREWCRKNRLGTTKGNGHWKKLEHPKRDYPKDQKCELCKKIRKRLIYHHWIVDKPYIGIWVCLSCHHICEGVEQDLHLEYLNLKSSILNHN